MSYFLNIVFIIGLTYFIEPECLKDVAQVHGHLSGGKKELVYKQLDLRVSQQEEIVVTVQGFVLRCGLPPVTRAEQ